MSVLFTPFTLKDVTLRNRIAVPPMCQYSAVDGLINDWHRVHLSGLARGGAGLVIVEATAVSPEGRITPDCAGLWNDAQMEALKPVVATMKKAGTVPGIQIAHAGRKASSNSPWQGNDHIPADDPRAWQPIAPSAIAFGADLPRVPKAMTHEDIQRVQQDFVAAAKRALEAGFKWLELHFAHGYLAQSFFSVHSNQRTDEYGGNAQNRGRFLLETLDAVRQVWPENLPLAIRFGVIEYDDRDAETLAEAADLCRQFKEHGADFLNVSIGFSIIKPNIPRELAFLEPVVARIRKESGLPVGAAWKMDEPAIIERIISEQKMDLAFVGHGHLANPHWTYQTARQLGIEKPGNKLLPEPYGWWLDHNRRH